MSDFDFDASDMGDDSAEKIQQSDQENNEIDAQEEDSDQEPDADVDVDADQDDDADADADGEQEENSNSALGKRSFQQADNDFDFE